jgi:beta-glucosidase
MSFVLSRRDFLAGSLALAAAETGDFPPDFLWGVSTSALQIEGAIGAGGRGPSIWETFAARPGAIADGSTPAVACDHYHRWPQDVGLMKQLGIGVYRFSIAWPRVMPSGRAPANAQGLDFYDRLVDALLASGIRPMPCLYHWDLPQALQDLGGWMKRDIAGWFADYATLVANRLGDRVKDWFCLNEPSVAAIFGHAYADHAPGLAAGERGALAALHHQNLAQGTALAALRGMATDARLGTILSLQPVMPATASAVDRAAAIRWDAVWNRVALDGVMRGQVPDVLAADLAAWVKPGDLEVIRFPLDWLGLNYYSPMVIQYQPGRLCDAGFAPAATPRRTAMGWPVVPEGLYQMLVELRDLYGNPPILITENGAAYDDRPGRTGRVVDADRIAFLRDHLRQVVRAAADGCRVEGYFVWSLLDNWEWQFGYASRFGLVYVDYATQRRLPKDSFAWYRAVTGSGRLP